MIINDYGDPRNPIWVVKTEPYDKDAEAGYIFSGGYGYNFKKTWNMAGLPDPYITTIKPCIGASYDTPTRLSNLLLQIETHRPTIIVPLDDTILNYLVPETTQQKEKNSSMVKWAGSILTCPFITHNHYIIGSHAPDWVTNNWKYKEIQGFIDYGHVKEEYEYWKKNGRLNPLPQRTLITEPAFDSLIDYLNSCFNLRYISHDIETIRPKAKSSYHMVGHPGYWYTSAIARSPLDAISFAIWDYTPDQQLLLVRLLDKLFYTVPQIGQNYFTFDSHHMRSCGMRICLDKCQDTLIRHHVLWPSLEHKLQFLTKQYTREPFYKDEGKHWSSRQKRQLLVYNAKDAAVTYEVWEGQELEFNDRPHLR